jgi:chromate reductase, NAD(P)H dehydrogenase (quinone)
MNVCVLIGSLRKASFNGMLANTLISLAPSSMKLDIVEIGNLPLYNQDLETNPPPARWTAFRQSVMAADAVLFVTPEYNRSVPAALKNALDVGSRPYGSSVWDRIPGAIVSSSPGAIGAFGANHHLRQSLVFLNVPTMQQPEAYVSMSTRYLMNMASWPATAPANSCRSSCRRSRIGSRRSDLTPVHLTACGNPVLPIEKPAHGERPSLEVVLRDCFSRPGYCWGWLLPWSVTPRYLVSFSSTGPEDMTMVASPAAPRSARPFNRCSPTSNCEGRRRGGVQGRPPDPVARRFRRAGRVARGQWRVVRGCHPAIQYHHFDELADPQCPALIRPIRARAGRRPHPRQVSRPRARAYGWRAHRSARL